MIVRFRDCTFTIKSFFFVTTVTLLITCSYYFLMHTYVTGNNSRLSSVVDNFTGDMIHVATLIDSGRSLVYMENLLKSLFYNQERFRCDLKNCCVSNLCDKFRDNCSLHDDIVSHSYPIVFHILTNGKSNSNLTHFVSMWKLHNVEYYFYDCSTYLERLQWIVSKHSSGAKPFVKLLLPEILPSSVNKKSHKSDVHVKLSRKVNESAVRQRSLSRQFNNTTIKANNLRQFRNVLHFYLLLLTEIIVLDIDMISNADIVELWNHFERFQETQMIGIGLEQNPYFQEVMKNLVNGWTGYGYNGGVLLFDLSKLRLIMWNDIWLSITEHLMKSKGYLITGEQDVINVIIFKYNDLFYEIPCEWNVQLSSGSDPERCPVSWLSYAELRKRNYVTINKQPKFTHINHHIKPEDKDFPTPVSTNTIDQSDVILKQPEMYYKFSSVYYKFSAVSRECFQ
ncbi:LARGE xylosyl- and glucuronyltransferase 2 [Schistosoma japonicum]|nr:LARGE xylosyl- and glucuronyltransferase 2 [Schistosoma japonicum]